LVDELPAAFSGGLCIWVDIYWNDLKPGEDIAIEVIAELITPRRTATFSEKALVKLEVKTTEGFARNPLLIPLAGTVYDQGRHILNVSTNTGSHLNQYLSVAIREKAVPTKRQTIRPAPALLVDVSTDLDERSLRGTFLTRRSSGGRVRDWPEPRR
jgi:hypothetical protein